MGRSKLPAATIVFISWSGLRAREVALALHAWIPDVLLDVQTWTSTESIQAGMRWTREVSEQLDKSNFGILCMTHENQNAPWILFEAGALAKRISTSRVVPYLIGLRKADLEFPLAQFQAVDADEAGTLELLTSINRTRETPLEAERLTRLFQRAWPELQGRLEEIRSRENPPTVPRSDRALLEEVLELVRVPQRLDQRQASAALEQRGADRLILGALDDESLDGFLTHLEREYRHADTLVSKHFHSFLLSGLLGESTRRGIVGPPATPETVLIPDPEQRTTSQADAN